MLEHFYIKKFTTSRLIHQRILNQYGFKNSPCFCRKNVSQELNFYRRVIFFNKHLSMLLQPHIICENNNYNNYTYTITIHFQNLYAIELVIHSNI